LKIADADSAENNSGSSHYVVTPLSCSLPNRRAGGPKASGEERLRIVPGTRLYSICGNEDYEKEFLAAGLRVSARGIQGETRAVELPDHHFFIATLFQPQLSSRPGAPHRIWLAFLRSAMQFQKARSRRGTSRASHGKARAKAAAG
jgi:CTP synthase (UTP-ammonia lyase)